MAVDIGDVEETWELLVGGDGGDGGDGGPGAGGVLFGFDGPVCRLFPEGSMWVAEELRHILDEAGALDILSPRERVDEDPHVVLRAVHRARGERDVAHLVGLLDEAAAQGEHAAVRTAPPTPDAHHFVEWLSGLGVRLSIATDNAERAADHYLRLHGLRRHFAAVHGRSADPELMKPHPDVLRRALRDLRLLADDAVLIGDTPTDFMAAERAGVRFVGYGRDAEKSKRLRDAGAEIVLGSYAPLLSLARQRGVGDVPDTWEP
ncbi:HAD-IA family hydrolase [Streptomyces sp. NPDC006134]|uniref:HAD family hydrolase n=1 Tax=Streptomyces sp. NPDC006134 TaxID=3154467 RepID=UPI0033EC590F